MSGGTQSRGAWRVHGGAGWGRSAGSWGRHRGSDSAPLHTGWSLTGPVRGDGVGGPMTAAGPPQHRAEVAMAAGRVLSRPCVGVHISLRCFSRTQIPWDLKWLKPNKLRLSERHIFKFFLSHNSRIRGPWHANSNANLHLYPQIQIPGRIANWRYPARSMSHTSTTPTRHPARPMKLPSHSHRTRTFPVSL